MYSINIWLSHSVVLINHLKVFSNHLHTDNPNKPALQNAISCVPFFPHKNVLFWCYCAWHAKFHFWSFCLFHFWNPSKLFANFWGKYLANKNFKKMFSFILCCICCPIRQALEYLFIGMFTMNTVCISKKYTFLCTNDSKLHLSWLLF